jgi:hypothetical protein
MADTNKHVETFAPSRIKRIVDVNGINCEVSKKISELKKKKNEFREKQLTNLSKEEVDALWKDNKEKYKEYKLSKRKLDSSDIEDDKKKQLEEELSKYDFTEFNEFNYYYERDLLSRQRVRFNQKINSILSIVVEEMIRELLLFAAAKTRDNKRKMIKSVYFVDEGHENLKYYPLYFNLNSYKEQLKTTDLNDEEKQKTTGENNFVYYITKLWSIIKSENKEFETYRAGKESYIYLSNLTVDFLDRLKPWFEVFTSLMKLRTIQEKMIKKIIELMMIDGNGDVDSVNLFEKIEKHLEDINSKKKDNSSSTESKSGDEEVEDEEPDKEVEEEPNEKVDNKTGDEVEEKPDEKEPSKRELRQKTIKRAQPLLQSKRRARLSKT